MRIADDSVGDRALEAAPGGTEGCVEVDEALLAAGAEAGEPAVSTDLAEGAAGDLVGVGGGEALPGA